jgi:toxin ParE1/3/4
VTKPVRVEEDAEEEPRAAVAWYEGHRPGPGLGPQVPDVRTRYETRRVPLRRFPYVLVYRERTNESQVIAFAHTSRMPGYWRPR